MYDNHSLGGKMSSIISYMISMLQYMLLFTPFFIIIRGVWLYVKKNKKINWYHEVGLYALVVYSIGIASQTIIPKFQIGMNGIEIFHGSLGGTNLIPFKVFQETYIEVFYYGNISYFLINFLGNIIMFMPFGFLIKLIWNKIPVKKAILIGLGISLFIEICQLPISRGSDVDDLWLNTLGVALGVGVYQLLNKKWNPFLKRFSIEGEKKK